MSKLTEKEQLIQEISSYDVKYGVFLELRKLGQWDLEKMKFMELYMLKNLLGDIKTFERNKTTL